MNQQEQHLADELEQLIQVAQAGQPVEPEQVPPQEAALAQDLVKLSQQTEAAPPFVTDLRARLRRRAQQIQKKPPEKASFWRDLTQMLKEGFTMKRTYALGALLTLIVFLGAVALGRSWLGGSDSPQIAVVATVPAETGTTTPDENTAVAQPGELAQLPRFETQNPGMGGGGDGSSEAATGESMASPLPVDGDFDMKMMDPFSGTTFILNGTLPVEAPASQVLQRQGEAAIDAALARQIADRFGFTGPLYTEQYPGGVPAGEPGGPPITYIAFDGQRTLRIDPWAINYHDDAAWASMNFENLNPHPDQGTIAEAFLRDRGLLDFPYEMKVQQAYDIFFYRVVDGRAANEPEITLMINPEGTVASMFDNVVMGWNEVGTYPLITAEQAWQRVLAGVFENNIQYHMIPADMGQPVPMPVEEPDFLADYKYWPREFTPGSEIHLYDWPMVYRPVDGGAPLVKIRNMTLLADEATLNALSEARENQIHLWGTLNEEGTQLQLAGWEALGEYMPISQQGVVRRVNDQLLFYGNEGDIYILPDAPADIEDGLEVNIFGYGVRDTGLEYPVLDWESIDKYIEYPEPPVEEQPIDTMPVEPFVPFRYGQVQIDAVELQYVVTYAWPEVAEGEELMARVSPTIYVQPAWAFSGTADNGDTIKLFVQAVDEAYLQPAP